MSLYTLPFSIATIHRMWDLLNSILCSLQGLAPSTLVQGQGSMQLHIVSNSCIMDINVNDRNKRWSQNNLQINELKIHCNWIGYFTQLDWSFSSFHKSSTDSRSRLIQGHFRIAPCFGVTQSVSLAVCFGSLSFWRTHDWDQAFWYRAAHFPPEGSDSLESSLHPGPIQAALCLIQHSSSLACLSFAFHTSVFFSHLPLKENPGPIHHLALLS